MYREFWSKASREQWQRMVLRYRANCSWIDSMFGRVMDKLRANGLLENCLIVYVSDHGEMLGERYYRFNKYCLYDASVRVPLILSGTAVPAGKRGAVDHRMAEVVDLYPTIAEIAGIPHDNGKPGENLLGPTVRKAGFCEYSDRPDKVSFMWRTSGHKLILSFPKEGVGNGAVRLADVSAGELYDLKADPKEWHNLFTHADSQAMREQMSRDLIAHLNQVALRRAAGLENVKQQ
jgi:arylsulfatase A-like enzyme